MKDTDVELIKSFNNEALNLEILAEEAAEVIQAKSKIMRFGLFDCHPKKGGASNQQDLDREIGEFLFMVDTLKLNGIVTTDGVRRGYDYKKGKLSKYYTYKQESEDGRVSTSIKG